VQGQTSISSGDLTITNTNPFIRLVRTSTSINDPIIYSNSASVIGIVDFNTANKGLYINTSTGFGAFGTNGNSIQANSLFRLHGAVTASTAIARAQNITTELVAAANNDVLVGLDVNPTFTNGAFTGVQNYGIRTQSPILVNNTVTTAWSATQNNSGLIIDNVNNSSLNNQFSSIRLRVSANNGASNSFVQLACLNEVFNNPSSSFVVNVRNSASVYNDVFRIFSTGNLLLQNGGTFTDAGFRLDVNGTARFFNTNTDAQIRFTPSSQTSTISLNSQSVFGGIQTAVSGTYIGLGLLTGSSGVVTNIGTTSTNGAGINFWGSLNGSAHSFKFFHNTNEIARLSYTGNLLLNTTTDAGFRLDVNGTARVQGSVSVIGGSGTNLTVTATAGVGSVTATKDNNFVSLAADGTSGYINYGVSTSGSRVLRFIGNGSEVARISTTGNLLINTTTDVASSKLTIESTTQGVLFPRMTTTQKNTITSPATGLVVYDTTLNKLAVYTGATWETVTSV
jgi:hypothetical protein